MKFSVLVRSTMTQTVRITVDAEDEEGAIDQAHAAASTADWNGDNLKEYFEVVDIQESEDLEDA